VLAGALRDNLEDLIALAAREPLSPEGMRNLVQLIVLIRGGDARLRDGALRIEGCRLDGIRFRNLDLTGVSFRGCDLVGAVFDGCTMAEARFEGAHLHGTAFRHGSEEGLVAAHFGDLEHFESVVVGDRRHFSDHREFVQWLRGAVAPMATLGPCPSARQLLVLFRKYVHVDGQGRRDAHARRSLLRGRQEPGGPSPEACLDAALDFGYLEPREFDQIRRATGPKYGEMVSFVKTQAVSGGLRSLLDGLCRAPGCPHVPRRP